MSEESVVSAEKENNYRLPHQTTLQHCAKLSIVEDKPIMFDYWTGSLDKDVLIGVRDSGEKLLVKSEDEYTSPISKIYKVDSQERWSVEELTSLIYACINMSRRRKYTEMVNLLKKFIPDMRVKS